MVLLQGESGIAEEYEARWTPAAVVVEAMERSRVPYPTATKLSERWPVVPLARLITSGNASLR